MSKGHNKPPIILELGEEMADFIIENCEANMEIGLRVMQMVHNDLMAYEKAEPAIKMYEKFKSLKQKLALAKKERNR